jgi:hypothetical protein
VTVESDTTTSGRPSLFTSPTARCVGIAPAKYVNGALNGTSAWAGTAAAMPAMIATPEHDTHRRAITPRRDPSDSLDAPAIGRDERRARRVAR